MTLLSVEDIDTDSWYVHPFLLGKDGMDDPHDTPRLKDEDHEVIQGPPTTLLIDFNVKVIEDECAEKEDVDSELFEFLAICLPTPTTPELDEFMFALSDDLPDTSLEEPMIRQILQLITLGLHG